jgi:hypothetical protein
MLPKRIVYVLWTIAAVASSAVVACAAPFNPKDIATDSAMFLHVDCDAIRASAIGQWLVSEPAVQDKLASLGTNLDVDLRKQLHGITFYTTEAHSKDGVMVINADFDPDQLLTKAQTNLSDFLAATDGSHVTYSWVTERWRRRLGRTARVHGAISGHHIIYGQTESRVADAMDVLEGTKPSADAGENPLYTKPGQRILLEVMIDKFDFPNTQGPAAVLQMCKSAYLKVSEANNTTTAALHLETADEDAGAQVNTIFQGFLGMLKMRARDTNETKFANSITITNEGLAVGVTLSMLSSDLIDIMKSGQQKAEQRKSTQLSR